MKMIPKSELKSGAYYLGFCRNSNIAMWDEDRNIFRYFRFKFVWSDDVIKHFEDCIETEDCFVPLEYIDKNKISEDVKDKIKIEIGY